MFRPRSCSPQSVSQLTCTTHPMPVCVRVHTLCAREWQEPAALLRQHAQALGKAGVEQQLLKCAAEMDNSSGGDMPGNSWQQVIGAVASRSRAASSSSTSGSRGDSTCVSSRAAWWWNALCRSWRQLQTSALQ